MKYLCLLLTGISLLLWGESRGQATVLDSTIFYRGIPGTAIFVPETRTRFLEWDMDQRPLLAMIQRRNEQGVWVDIRPLRYEYTGDKMTGMAWQNRPDENAPWTDFKLRTFVYEGDELVQRQVSQAPAPGDNLEPRKRWSYTYDTEGNRTGLLYQEWSGGNWRNISRQQWQYAAGVLQLQLSQQWNEGDWQNRRRRQWYYHSGAGLVKGVHEQRFDPATGEWQNVRRTIYPLNSAGQPGKLCQQLWDEPAEAWVNLRQEVVEYDSLGQFSNRRLQLWEEDAWQDLFRTQYVMGSDQTTILADRWDEAQGEWTSYARQQQTIDASGLPVSELGWQYRDGNSDEWLNGEITYQRRYFRSETATAVTERLLPRACRVPNPLVSGAVLACEELDPAKTYQLRLLTMAGQAVYVRNFSGNGPWPVNHRLPAGLYLLSLSTPEGIVHLQKVMLP